MADFVSDGKPLTNGHFGHVVMDSREAIRPELDHPAGVAKVKFRYNADSHPFRNCFRIDGEVSIPMEIQYISGAELPRQLGT
ncbi:hypothetical protein D3C86_1806580 [compost metagenome]